MSGPAAQGAASRLGLGLALGVASAMVTALPAALRSGPASPLGSWFLLGGSTALFAGPLVAAILELRSGAASSLRQLRVLTVALLVSAGPLAVLGTALEAGTHHRPLGGATFAVVAAAVVLAAIAGAHRLYTWADEGAGLRAKIGQKLALLLGVAGAAVVALLLIRLSANAGPVRTGLLDGLRALGLAALAAVVPLPASLRVAGARFGLPIWVGVVLAAFGLAQVPSVATPVDRAAPVLLAPVAWSRTGLGGG